MARSEGNLIADGFRGKVGGNLVFRKRKSGKVIVGKTPKKTEIPPTVEQVKIREKFTEAATYATAVINDPELKEMYAEAVTGDQSAFNLALRDAAKAPEVTVIRTLDYTGQPGSTIAVRAKDDFKVVRIKVQVYSAAGILIEQGDTVLDRKGLDWIYTATTMVEQLAGVKIKAIAFDFPDNQGEKEITL